MARPLASGPISKALEVCEQLENEQMKRLHGLLIAAIVALIEGLVASSVAHADIVGFGDFSGFTVNQNDTGSPPTISGGTIQLTSANNETRTIFYDTPQNISIDFTVSFTFKANGVSTGASLVLQDSASGASAIGPYLDPFGYQFFPGKSIGLTLEGGNNASGLYTDGNYGGGSPSTSPVNLSSGDPINVSLTYNGSTLQESLLDTKTNGSYSKSFLILTPFSTVLGASTAYVGLAATSTSNNAGYYFSNLQFTTSPVPEPSTLALLGVSAIGFLASVWRRARSHP